MKEELRQCQNCKKQFTVGPDELAMYDKLEMPLPKECFSCATAHRLSFWVFGKFRKGVSDLSGQRIITTLPETPRYPVYTQHEWYSDAWDGMEFGRDYDPQRPFFEQLKELQEKIPRPHQTGENNVDCDWCDDVWESKNCYLSRSMGNCENVLYGYRIVNVKDSIDVTYSFDTQKSYDCTYCFNCFNLRYSFNCRDAISSAFLYDCRNVQNCFMCWNLRNKQYHILNEPYSKEAYAEKIKQYNLGSWRVVRELEEQFWKLVRDRAVHRENFNFKTVDSVGNYLTNCKRCVHALYWEDSEDCYNCFRGLQNKSFIDVTGVWQGELQGNNANAIGGYMMKYSAWASHCRYSEYLDQCIDCEYCFGCVGLKKKKYCILNKQYTKEEYEALRARIIENMKREGVYGDYFPYSLAYCGYNYSVAQVMFPKSKEEVLKLGSWWEEIETGGDGMKTAELPDDIADVTDAITTQPLLCPETGYRFNISDRELAFYREMRVPLPRLHFDARNFARFRRMMVFSPEVYECTFCKKKTEAYYPREWGYERIACIDCYQREVA